MKIVNSKSSSTSERINIETYNNNNSQRKKTNPNSLKKKKK